MKKYLKYTINFLFLLLSFSVSAQLTQGKRIEIEQNNNIEEEHILIPLKENGVILVQTKIEPYHKKLTLDFTKYDSTLTQIWKSTFLPDEGFELIKTFYNERSLYLLFKKDNKVDIGVLKIDFETGDKTYVEGNLLTNIDIEQFVVLESKAIIGGKYNERPVVVMFSFYDKLSKVLPEIHNNYFIINDLAVDELEQKVYLMLKNERNCQFMLKTYSYEGKPISTVTLGDKQTAPISGKILNLDNKKPILLGSYAEGCSLLSIGFYVQNLSGDSKTQYINFADLKNFFKFLNPKREEKIKSRISQKKQKGKEIKLRNRLLIHDIIPNDEGWVMVAEIFYPEYKNNSNALGFGTWRNYRIGNDVYNNFRYSHVIICGFDKNAKLIWDNSVSLKDLESSELNDKVQITQQNGYQILAYPDESFIKTVVIREGEKAKDLESFDLKTSTDTEKITSSDHNNLTAWYGNSYLAYGYQSVKKSNDVLNKEVYFITKLSYGLKLEK